MNGIFTALMQEEREAVLPYLVRIFGAYLSTGYVPNIWRQVKVVFIHKSGKNSYSGPTDYRPINLTSLFITVERMVHSYLGDKALAQVSLHPKQHVYQDGKSVETAIHRLVVRVEKALDQQRQPWGFS